MKKIFKSKRISNIIFGVLGLVIGGVIFGTIGIVATTNKLEAKYVMYTKDGKTMTVQDAIKDLYVLANNKGGSNQTLPLGNVTVSGTQITIPYTGTYDKITCVYGTTESYGSTGTISGNTCTFSGSSNTKYYYKLIATKIANNTGVVYENSGNKTTSSGPTAVKTGLPTGVKAIVYLDPTDLSKSCNAGNSTVGGTAKSGCMKWYAFKEDSTSYTMILDHNTTSNVAWNSSNINTSMKEVQTELNNLKNVTGWKVTTRLIHAQEIATITGNTSWTTSSAKDGFFYLDNNTQTCILNGTCSVGANKYYWLFDYTTICTSHGGCKVADTTNGGNFGYWTDTPLDNDDTFVWYVTNSGKLQPVRAEYTGSSVRPVITVSKSNF